MANQEQLKIQIVLDDGDVRTGFLDMEKQGQSTAKKLEGSFAALGAGIVAAFSVVKTIGFLKQSASDAMEAEKAINSFGASLAQIGKFSQEAVSSFESYASQLQATTGISDDLIKQNAALLVSIGNLSGQGLNEATKAALDLSTALQIDVGTGFDLVAKAATGNVGALGRYGIKIDDSIPKSEKFAATLDLIQKRFGGLAETKLNTFEGSLTNLSNAFGEIRESIGKFIVSSPALRETINSIAKVFFSLSESIEKVRLNSGDIFQPIILSAISFASAINEYFIKPLELGFNLLKTGILSVKLLFDGLVVVVVGFSKLLVEAIVFPIRDIVNGIASLISVVDSEIAGKLTSITNRVANNLTQPLQNEFENTKLILANTFNELSQNTEDTFKSKMGGSIGGFLDNLKTSVESAKGTMIDFKNSTSSSVNETAEATKDAAVKTKSALQNILENGVSSSIEGIGKNLAEGKGLFDDFGSSVAAIMGDMAISIGRTLLFTGPAIEAFITAINSLLPGSGLVAAAAGLGLILFGSALKASVGKSSSNNSSSGGGIATTPSASTELTPTQDLERLEPQTAVSVVIQGDVLDSDESGSRIVALINQAFDKKGVVINQGVIA